MIKGRPLKVILDTIQEGENEPIPGNSIYERYVKGVSRPFEKFLPPEPFEKKWGLFLRQASLPFEIDRIQYYQFLLGHSLICLLSLALEWVILSGVLRLTVSFMILYLAIFPLIWVKEKAGIRMRAIKKEMPSIIMILAITMEAGTGLNQAIREITKVKTGEFVTELTKYLELLEMGYSRKDALNQMSEKLTIIEITQFTSLLQESLDKGTDGLSKSLKALSESIWDKRVETAKVLASKASAKLFLPLLLLVFPAMLIFILSPAVFSIMKHF